MHSTQNPVDGIPTTNVPGSTPNGRPGGGFPDPPTYDDVTRAGDPPSKPQKLRHRSTKDIARVASGSLRRGTRMLLIHTVPEEARNHMEDRSAMWTGLTAILLLTIALVGLVFFYSRCTTAVVLVDQPDKSHTDCMPQLTVNNGAFLLDVQGNWSTDPRYRPSQGLWTLSFVNEYSADSDTFRQNIEDIFTKLEAQLDRLMGRRWYEVLQGLSYANLTVNGESGYMVLRPNMDLGLLIGNKITDWAQARDMSAFVGGDLPREDAKLRSMSISRWPQNCSSVTIVQGYDFLQVKGKRAVTVVDKEKQFSKGYVVYDPKVKNPDGTCTKTTVPLAPTDAVDTLGVPVLMDIVDYPGRTSTFDIQFDVTQVFSIDWCNRNWHKCIADFCPEAEASSAALSANFSNCARGRLLELGSTERFPTVFSPHADRLGFLWEPRRVRRSNGQVEDRKYLVVPELLPDYDCVTCGGDADEEIDCQSFLGIEMHYYRYDPANDAATAYFNTFEYSVQLDGAINAEMARPRTQCDTADLRMKGSPAQLRATMQQPFDLTKGVVRCKLQICKSPLEKLSLSFSNVALLYTVFCVLVVLVVMYANGKKAEAARRAAQLHASGGQLRAPSRVSDQDDIGTRRLVSHV